MAQALYSCTFGSSTEKELMTRKNNHGRKQYRTVHFLCCTVFCVFTFLYLFYYQGDVLALAQHILSEGATTYDAFIGASVVTFVMLLVHFIVYSMVSLDKWFYWLTYLPSFLFLAILTDVSPTDEGGVYNYSWLWIAPLLLVIYAFLVRSLSEIDSLSKDFKSVQLFSKTMWINMLSLTIMMLMVVGISNTDVTLHHRIKMESHIINGDYDEALNVGREYSDADESLTMLRAYALSKKGQLGEHIFEYPVIGGSRAFYPDGRNVRSLMIYNGDITKFIRRRGIGHNNVQADYKLCGQLADCSLDKFARDVRRYYKYDMSLPKHYKEALLLYNDVAVGDTVEYADTAMVARFNQFKKACKHYAGSDKLHNVLNKDYFGTYWYYYACIRKF